MTKLGEYFWLVAVIGRKAELAKKKEQKNK
jgi:hypothetical protein